jgi:aspartyl-tRNA(Asn)/glutamyl-tRNA(Gln) amidotransferase subunit A
MSDVQTNSTDLCHLTIAEASRLMAGRSLSPVELTQALIARAEEIDSRLHAFLRPTFDTAMEDARQAERDIMKGNHRGPMQGIPYGVKDVIDAAGIPTTGQSRAYANYLPGQDSAVVAKLKAAGALLMGKLTTHECAHGGPSYDLAWPLARNPWNLDHFTGGSSSGSGAAVAAGLVPAALGTDTGGSIRSPAGLCGIVGMKPTSGLVSRVGVMPNSFTYDNVGPMTRTAEDCAILLQTIAGHDLRDPTSAEYVLPDIRKTLTGDIKGLRIGFVRHLHEEDAKIAPAAAAALERALDVLRSLGATTRDVRLRPARAYLHAKVTVAESELFAVHEKHLRERPGDFGEDFLNRLLPAMLIRGADYVQAQRLRRIMQAEFAAIFDSADVLITAGQSLAPRLGNWRPVEFWKASSPPLTTPFNVGGGPALVQCIGYEGGLPMSMQIAGRHFDDATVLRVADAYERATQGQRTHPVITPETLPGPLPSLPDPEPLALPQREQDELSMLCERVGLKLTDRMFRHLCGSAPYAKVMLRELHRPEAFTADLGSLRF